MKKTTKKDNEIERIKEQVLKLETLFKPHKTPFVEWEEKKEGVIIQNGKKITYSYIINVKAL